MTREELLEAIGRVDDDLIQEAEDCRLPARKKKTALTSSHKKKTSQCTYLLCE